MAQEEGRARVELFLRIPRAEEVVILGCHEDNLTAAHLDVVSEFLEAAGVQPLGFLYVAQDQLEAAMIATAKAGSVWRSGSILGPAAMTRRELGVS